MKRMIVIACALAMISGGAQAQASVAQAPAPLKPHAPMRKTKRASAKKPVPAAPPVQPVPAHVAPPVPATLMNSAPVNPNVTMTNGLLTIDAPNSTLGEVLRGVHNATGAEIEGASSPTDRVAVRLGPGDPRQVIAALLEGTPYDYLILGSQEKPDAVTRIVLTQSSGESPEGASAQNGPASRPRLPMAQPPANEDSSHAEDTDSHPAGENQAEQTEQPPAQPEQNTPNAQNGTNTPNGANAPKTPEQLFKELMPQPAQPANQPAQP